MKHWIGCTMALMAAISSCETAWAETPPNDSIRFEQMQKQIDTLQDNVDNLRLAAQKNEPIRTFSNMNFSLGGWVTEAFTSLQASGSDRYSFNDSDFGLLASADISERTHFLGNLEFHRTAEDANYHTPDRRFENFESSIDIEIAQVSHDFSDRVGLRGGQMITPFGIVNVEHFDPIHLQNDLPQFLRDTPGEPFGMLDDTIRGLDVYGNFRPFSGHRITLEAYTASLQSDTNKLAGGGRQTWTFPGDQATVGASQQAGSRDGTTFLTLGEDFKFQHKRFLLRSEAAQTIIGGKHLYAFYVQPSYNMTEKWILFAQVDYFDNPLNLTQDVVDPIRQYEHTLGLNFLPAKNLRLRAEITDHQYVGATRTFEGRSRDFLSLQTSITVSF